MHIIETYTGLVSGVYQIKNVFYGKQALEKLKNKSNSHF
jgi:hypothetical protein